MLCRKSIVIQLFTCFILQSVSSAQVGQRTELLRRTPYPIPLVKLSIQDNGTAIRISREGSDDYAIISDLSDKMVKNSRNKTDKITYRETVEKAYYLTDFEAKQLLIVCRSLEETLIEFEKNLQHQKWGQCLYLDAFLPKFIKGFYLLIGATKNNSAKYARETRLFNQKFDVSLNSPLSDRRITSWRTKPECIVKLRIATKELIYQLKAWEKRELTNRNRNPEISLSLKCEEALGLFVRIYFSLSTPAFCSEAEKKRLYH